MSRDFKAEFGRRFREARDAKKISRATLGLRLGISPKTIQSWEMGRTFIEDLSLMPAIEAELEIVLSDLMEAAKGAVSGQGAAEMSASGRRKQARASVGPQRVRLDLHVLAQTLDVDLESLSEGLMAVPLVRPQSVIKPVSDLMQRDIIGHVAIPGIWVPRGGVLVAYRMGDSGMSPMVPLGGVVIVDRRPPDPSKALRCVVAMYLKNKGMRVRLLVQDPDNRRLYGVTVIEGRRGRLPFRPESGDSLLGRVVGILSQPE